MQCHCPALLRWKYQRYCEFNFPHISTIFITNLFSVLSISQWLLFHPVCSLSLSQRRRPSVAEMTLHSIRMDWAISEKGSEKELLIFLLKSKQVMSLALSPGITADFFYLFEKYSSSFLSHAWKSICCWSCQGVVIDCTHDYEIKSLVPVSLLSWKSLILF